MRIRNRSGFTLVELLIVIGIIGILAAIAIPLYTNLQAGARIARAQADARSLASAVTVYSATFGSLPATLADLAAVQSIGGVTGGPFMKSIPTPPVGWTVYSYTSGADGTFTISASGDGTSVNLQ